MANISLLSTNLPKRWYWIKAIAMRNLSGVPDLYSSGFPVGNKVFDKVLQEPIHATDPIIRVGGETNQNQNTLGSLYLANGIDGPNLFTRVVVEANVPMRNEEVAVSNWDTP